MCKTERPKEGGTTHYIQQRVAEAPLLHHSHSKKKKKIFHQYQTEYAQECGITQYIQQKVAQATLFTHLVSQFFNSNKNKPKNSNGITSFLYIIIRFSNQNLYKVKRYDRMNIVM